ncbi:MAG: nicotinate phosphoribosyltransferase [Herpetosiphonaceae bacterium]|nr:nicotinate phosphoribosyltransferase [Herpetosiphonaceae bacterium]
MTIFDHQRLAPDVFKLDVERMRAGWYSDQYFANIIGMLTDLAHQGYRFGGTSPYLDDLDIDLQSVDIGNLVVEMQWFTRRKPFSVVAGVDKALAMLETCTGYLEDGVFHSTWDRLQVEAVQDGTIVHYGGDPRQVEPVIKVRGRYRDFALVETPTLGALTRGTRVATNVYNVLVAAHGKSVLFFPARFDAHEVQAADGYAYNIAVQRFNHDFAQQTGSFISTDAQGDWWGGFGGGTIAHAAIAAFLGDTAETMMAFAATRPVDVSRIALVDFLNDCVGTTLDVMDKMFARYKVLMDAGCEAEAQKFKLFGVRPDTGGTMRDVSVPPIGAKKVDMGVNPRLCFFLRSAIDSAWQRWNLEGDWLQRGQEWCRDVKIVVTGGFSPAKIRRFEELNVPVDIYGVGSSLFSNSDADGTNNDFTADIVRVQIEGRWYNMAKVGRQPCGNPMLERIQ